MQCLGPKETIPSTDILLHIKSEKTVAMVLLSECGHISTATGPNHMTQESICRQGCVLYLFPPPLSRVPMGGCSARIALYWD
jgi:hypothetical protein